MCLYPKLNSPYLSVAAEVQKDAVKLVITGTFAQLTVVTVSQLAMLGGFAVLSCRLARDREAQSLYWNTLSAHRTPTTLIGDGIFLCCQNYICKCDSNVPTGHEEQRESSTH